MKMLRNNYIIIITTFFSIFLLPSVNAQNIKNIDAVTTKTIDWKIIESSSKKPPRYLDAKTCGNITIDLPQWVRILVSNLIIKRNFPHDTTAPYGQHVLIWTNCSTKNLDFPKASEGYGFFNDKSGKWEITDKYKNDVVEGTHYPKFKIYQLKARNSSGFFMTITDKGHYTDSNDILYNKQGSFCLYTTNHTKQFCGSGYVQYTPHLGSSQSDYTPMLMQFLQTVRFVDDK